jgi:hypothetical protein
MQRRILMHIISSPITTTTTTTTTIKELQKQPFLARHTYYGIC